jgi:hypothetical protein
LAPFSKLLTQLVNDARLTLCILGVTVVRNFFKITIAFMVFTGWRCLAIDLITKYRECSKLF